MENSDVLKAMISSVGGYSIPKKKQHNYQPHTPNNPPRRSHSPKPTFSEVKINVAWTLNPCDLSPDSCIIKWKTTPTPHTTTIIPSLIPMATRKSTHSPYSSSVPSSPRPTWRYLAEANSTYPTHVPSHPLSRVLQLLPADSLPGIQKTAHPEAQLQDHQVEGQTHRHWYLPQRVSRQELVHLNC